VSERAGSAGHALVTGGAGFLGSWLCDALLDQGWRVTCVDNCVTGSEDNLAAAQESPHFEFRRADVTRPFAADSVDVLYHLASIASPVHYQRLPVETLLSGSHGTMNALEAARAAGARFVLASTSEVYGDPEVHPQREDYWGHVNPVGERSMYDEAKRYSEAATMAYRRTYGLDTGIVRIFNTYGPRMALDDGRMVPTFLQQAMAGEPLTVTGTGSQTRSLCYVSDTVRGLIAMADSNLPGPVNIGNPGEVSVREIAGSILTLLREGWDESDVRLVDARPDDPMRRCPDIGRAREQLGWSPEVDWADGLERTIVWFRERLAAR
jgi:dTDP-glucose 4,6-dehydratase